ncbi:two component transcriptional regulator, LytTR family [Nonlabens sp. Hel1_33_55]|uniref:response regulator n=1 Tax=Nonlabens sp. Hel1_33_55 TaxID=1336802 RepID=UPI000875B83C|nr:response regulator [Nonlabens sp. Hel1_33_55]SCY19965.1 two component transcriptional regulator, LytTR family [Nonlabens sp. Hel1_33_55]
MKRILIVEDELMIAGNIERMLSKKGYQVAAIAIDYEQAERQLKTYAFDLVLLDVALSGSKSGVDVAKLINKDYGIPFIYITSYSDPKTIDELKTTRPAGYISKPIQAATLTTNVDLLFSRLDHHNDEVTLQIGNGIHKYHLDSIFYAQADHVYTEIFHDQGSDVLRISLQALQDQFPKNELIRINRSVAVSRRAVVKVDKTTIYLQDTEFRISRSMVDEVQEQLR